MGFFCAIYLGLICAAASSAPSRHAEVGGAQGAAYSLKAEQAGARVRDVSLISEICCVRRRLTYLAAASRHFRREPELPDGENFLRRCQEQRPFNAEMKSVVKSIRPHIKNSCKSDM